MKTNNKRAGFYLRLNENEQLVIESLKKDYSMNISQMIKNFLRKSLEELSRGKENK
jgi:hypothetical protein